MSIVSRANYCTTNKGSGIVMCSHICLFFFCLLVGTIMPCSAVQISTYQDEYDGRAAKAIDGSYTKYA